MLRTYTGSTKRLSAAICPLAVAIAATVALPALAQSPLVHDTQTAFSSGVFDQTVLAGTESAPLIRLATYPDWNWTFQDTEIAGWNFNAGTGNLATENPPGQIHLRALSAGSEAYAFASRNDVAVPQVCSVEFVVYLDAIGPSNSGGLYGQPRGACARLDVHRADGGLRLDIFSDKMVSFYREGTTGYNYPTLTEVDVATETGRWYTYRLDCERWTGRRWRHRRFHGAPGSRARPTRSSRHRP
ncbi:MAG: hypothetical protein LC667_10385 [Thioalkalivibrio sp.]|nr:hypothetical protein [Thioalkalivibrio sp.]